MKQLEDVVRLAIQLSSSSDYSGSVNASTDVSTSCGRSTGKQLGVPCSAAVICLGQLPAQQMQLCANFALNCAAGKHRKWQHQSLQKVSESHECKAVACVLLIWLLNLKVDIEQISLSHQCILFVDIFNIHWNVPITASWGALLSCLMRLPMYPIDFLQGWQLYQYNCILLDGTEGSFSGIRLSWQEQGNVVCLKKLVYWQC